MIIDLSFIISYRTSQKILFLPHLLLSLSLIILKQT
nr:MAG TPA: hypothetical protein [Herelleviridae sp.]